jgi:hypothetical protein
MSQKNKRINKTNRRNDRRAYSTDNLERSPLSDIPNAAAVGILSDPVQKITRAVRKSISEGRGACVLYPNTTAPTDFAVKALVKLSRLPLERLIRERSRTARRASSAMYLARTCSLGGKSRANYENLQYHYLAYLKQVVAELGTRGVKPALIG